MSDVALILLVFNFTLMFNVIFTIIERSQKVLNHRGVKLEDGLVRIEFQFEKKLDVITTSTHGPFDPFDPYYNNITGNPTFNNMARGFCKSVSASGNSSEVYYSALCDIGITAPGSISDQEFNSVSNFTLKPTKHVMILRLLGEHQGKVVSNVTTTRSRITCDYCGNISKSSKAKFCSDCGASLQIIY